MHVHHETAIIVGPSCGHHDDGAISCVMERQCWEDKAAISIRGQSKLPLEERYHILHAHMRIFEAKMLNELVYPQLLSLYWRARWIVPQLLRPKRRRTKYFQVSGCLPPSKLAFSFSIIHP